MSDWLVQRHILNAPNSSNGGWVDEGIARDLKADEHDQAIAQAANPSYQGKRRAIRWDHVHEADLTPGPPSVVPTVKSFDEQPRPESSNPKETNP